MPRSPFRLTLVVLLSLILFTSASAARAQVETPIVIHVTADNGKPLGAVAGEAQVILRDKITGDALASGQTHDGRFEVSIDLVRPLLATVAATGPLANPPGLATVSRDIVLVPGKNYGEGSGIALQIPGNIVTLTTPQPGEGRALNQDGEIIVNAYVSSLDGTPATDQLYDIETSVYSGAVLMATVKMRPTGTPGYFGAKLKFPQPGTYIIIVTAFDPTTKNAGMDQSAFTVGGAPTPSPEKK